MFGTTRQWWLVGRGLLAKEFRSFLSWIFMLKESKYFRLIFLSWFYLPLNCLLFKKLYPAPAVAVADPRGAATVGDMSPTLFKV